MKGCVTPVPPSQDSTAPDQLEDALRHGPFDLALRLAIARRDLGLARLLARVEAKGLHLSMSSLSNWQHGRSRPERADSLEALSALEAELGLDVGALARLLGPPRPRGPKARQRHGLNRTPTSLRWKAVSQLLDALPGFDEHRYDTDLVEETVEVDADSVITSTTVRMVVTAVTDDVDSSYTGLMVAPDEQIDLVELEPVEGCHLRAVHDVPAERTRLWEIGLDLPLSRGESAVLAYRRSNRNRAPALHYGYAVSSPTTMYVLRVRFAGTGSRPACHEFDRSSLPGEMRVGRQVPVNRRGEALARFGPPVVGAAGLTWAWPDR